MKYDKQLIAKPNTLANTLYSGISCTHNVFEEQVRKTLDATAIRIGEQRYNYHKLNTLSNRLAHYLTNYVIKPNTLVVLYLRPSLEVTAAVLKATDTCITLHATELSNLACAAYEANALQDTNPIFLSHIALINTIQCQIDKSRSSIDSTTLRYNAINCKSFYQQIFAIWYSNDTLVVMHDQLRHKPVLFWHFIDKERINRLRRCILYIIH